MPGGTAQQRKWWNDCAHNMFCGVPRFFMLIRRFIWFCAVSDLTFCIYFILLFLAFWFDCCCMTFLFDCCRNKLKSSDRR